MGKQEIGCGNNDPRKHPINAALESDFNEPDALAHSRGGRPSTDAHNIEGSDFAGADLAGRDLTGVAAGEANFAGALLEDANLEDGVFRFAQFQNATLDGARCARADFWGAILIKAEAPEADFQAACLKDADMSGANLQNAVLKRADLHNTDLSIADLRGADLTEAVLKGTNLTSADLRGASLSGLNLESCQLDGVMLAGAWLERSRMTRSQLGRCVGEERVGDFEGAGKAYLALEINFRGLGDDDAARWAYCKRRRMAKNCQRINAVQSMKDRQVYGFLRSAWTYITYAAVEFLCDYGESVGRVLRAIFLIYGMTVIALIVSGSLSKLISDGSTGYRPTRDFADIATYTFMTTITALPPADMKLNGQLANLAVGVETAIMIVLLGLLGFVLGNRIRG